MASFRSLGFELVAVSLGCALAAVSGCSTDSDDPNANVIGTVLVDDEIAQGVGIMVEDSIGNEDSTTTDQQGSYAFITLPGEQTVTLISGIPDDAECTPGSSQTVTAPEPGTGNVKADFACDTSGGGGAGGAGGRGGAGGGGGGAGGSGGAPACGLPSDSMVADLAGNVRVFVNDVEVTGETAADVQQGDSIRVEVPVTAGARFVSVQYANSMVSESLAAFGSPTQGNEVVVLPLLTMPMSFFPTGVFPLLVIVENEGPTRTVFYNTVLPGCDLVEMVVDNNGEFTNPVPAPFCTPSCLNAIAP